MTTWLTVARYHLVHRFNFLLLPWMVLAFVFASLLVIGGRTADRIAQRRGSFEACPCHNDLLAANFIHGGERLWLVDWEYAGMGDPAFDLANFAVNNGLDEAGDDELLGAYGGGDPDVHVLMRYVSDLREAMWGLVQQAVAAIDFDYAGYADDHFARLEQTAAEPRFGRALR